MPKVQRKQIRCLTRWITLCRISFMSWRTRVPNSNGWSLLQIFPFSAVSRFGIIFLKNRIYLRVHTLTLITYFQFWLVVGTLSVVCFMIVTLSVRAVYAPSNASMLLYGFLIIFILSCIWTFSYMYEVRTKALQTILLQTI